MLFEQHLQTSSALRAGFMLLRGEWPDAVCAILAERAGDRPHVAAARQMWLQGGDAAAAAAAMPRQMVAERAVLQVPSLWCCTAGQRSCCVPVDTSCHWSNDTSLYNVRCGSYQCMNTAV